MFEISKMNPYLDSRGAFLKLMEDGTYPKNYKLKNQSFTPLQVFISATKQYSIRGMHFYKPVSDSNDLHSQSNRGATPSDIDEKFTKSFVVIFGEIFMAAIDLRDESESKGKIETKYLKAYDQVCLPKMIASGFQVTSQEALILYFLDTAHIPQNDISINPLLCGIRWPLPVGEISLRDKTAISLEEYIRNGK